MLQPEPAGTTALLTLLRALHPISPEAENYLREHVSSLSIGKRKLLLKEGATCDYIYFVVRGALRGFTREEQKKDITTWITIENELVTSILGLDARRESVENIQALEKCEL